MKSLRLLGLSLLLVVVAVASAAESRTAAWRDVDLARQQGLPRAAIEKLGLIAEAAQAAGAYAEAIKAMALRATLVAEIEGNKPEEKIALLAAALERAPAEMKPAMEAILAHWYWQYFEQNRWQIARRGLVDDAAGSDLRTWGLARLLAEVDRHFGAALADEGKTQSTPIAAFGDLLVPASMPDRYRPTLFDFLAYQALDFYQAGEQGVVRGEDEFEFDSAVVPVLGDTAAFLAWSPASSHESVPVVRALRLYQRLLRFHENDADRSAFLEADLARLEFGGKAAVGDDAGAGYKAALLRFAERNSAHEISACALALLAQLELNGDPRRAHELAARGMATFPDSKGGTLCAAIATTLEAKTGSFATERVWNAPWPTLDVTHRHFRQVHFRAVSFRFEDWVRGGAWHPWSIDLELRRQLLAAPPALAWTAALPATEDFKEHTEKLPAPQTLRPGFYFVLSSFDDDFTGPATELGVVPVWVGDLALVERQHSDRPGVEGLVVRAIDGSPVAGARVRCWIQDTAGHLRERPTTTTDADGRYEINEERTRGVVLVERGEHGVSSDMCYFASGADPERRELAPHVVFFTDRAIYRPGQSIRFKGIAMRADPQAGKYAVVPDARFTVEFTDPNSKQIASAEVRTNAFGSFSGEFTAPRDRLLGSMSIGVKDGSGETEIRVEEYKRPKFQAELAPPAEAPRLGGTVELAGHATAFSGAPIGGAKVAWRIERNAHLPAWCWWWRPEAPRAIAHGTAATAADGSFTIRFDALSDRSVAEKSEPVFAFEITADVTDSTGETRSATRVVQVGYRALQATVVADQWQTPDLPVKISVATFSVDGELRAARGTVTIRALRQPARPARAPLIGESAPWNFRAEPPVDPLNPDSWEVGDVVVTLPFASEGVGNTALTAKLPVGYYRATLETADRFGGAVTAHTTIRVLDPGVSRCVLKVPDLIAAPKWSVEPGETFMAVWGTGRERGQAFVELECNGEVLQRYWTDGKRTQQKIALPVTEAMRGGFTLRVVSVSENRAYVHEQTVDVPWSDRRLTVTWESFRSKLLPGQKERWTAVVSGPDAKRAAAEMVATLYDASLDQFAPLNFPRGFPGFRQESFRGRSVLLNSRLFSGAARRAAPEPSARSWSYRGFPAEVGRLHWTNEITGRADWTVCGNSTDGDIVVLSPFCVDASSESLGYMPSDTLAGTRLRTNLSDLGSSISVVTRGFLEAVAAGDSAELLRYTTGMEVGGPGGAGSRKPDLGSVTARRNLAETAFFFPHLRASDDGKVRIEFTMPEALATWRFLAFAHDRKLRSGFLAGAAVTAKDLMVEPNPPRFLREGDELEFTVKVTNRSAEAQAGTVRLSCADAETLRAVDDRLGNIANERAFAVPAHESRTYAWRLKVPDGLGFLTYRVVGASASFSDGEEGNLPVLSRRVLVTESLPLAVRGPTTREFEFTKLLASGKSGSLRNQSLTVQMVSRPAWTAVMALPYLMEFPHECSEQLFNRYYANAVARHLAESDPQIRRVFDLWKNTPALDSPLTKNAELKSVLLEETPWVRDAVDEGQARRAVGLLFEANRLDEESARVLRQLGERQGANGLWSWFPGGAPSEFISLYVVAGFGRLRELGVEADPAPAVRALGALDEWIVRRHAEIVKGSNDEAYAPDALESFYLYGRSFFLRDRPVAGPQRAAFDFFLRQARTHWLDAGCRQSQAHLALALQRFGDAEAAQAIVRSLKEHSVTDPELGRFWRDTETAWFWDHAPIETQAMMIEAFDVVAHDAMAVEECKVWLLKQKQTQDWGTTKATADAVYALLARGENLLTGDALVEVSLGGRAIHPETTEAGTGFFETRFARDGIKPEQGKITVRKRDAGPAWGAVHWQYLADIAEVSPHSGTPLQVKKALFVKETTANGPVLRPVTGAVQVGDELVVRLEIRNDRDLEFVHLKDQRGSGTEPVAVLSRYHWQDGIGYYETTRDTATHRYIDWLPKGMHVFETSVRIQHRGVYQAGLAEIQCMYAPEFNAHSESPRLEVK